MNYLPRDSHPARRPAPRLRVGGDLARHPVSVSALRRCASVRPVFETDGLLPRLRAGLALSARRRFPRLYFDAGHRPYSAPLIIGLELAFAPPVQVLATAIIALATVMMIGLLQPAKGAVIALQWWTGMHGFVRERRSEQTVRSDIIG